MTSEDSQADVHATELVSMPAIAAAPQLPKVQVTDLYAALLADARSPATMEARRADVRDFCRFCGGGLASSVCAQLAIAGKGMGNALATAYVRSMLDRRLSSATINRRICTLRRLLVLAAKFDLGSYTLDIERLPDEPYRDTTGPGQAGWVRVLASATGLAKRASVHRRNLAILRLLHDHGLRREEVSSLDLEHYDADAGRLWVMGKGRKAREATRLNKQTLQAMEIYLDVRGRDPGPLFVRLDRARAKDRLQRLDADAIHKAVAMLGARAGLQRKLWPHALRHAAVTRVLELTNGNLDAAQRFARHADPRTTQRYNDARKDVAGEMARLLGADA